MSISWTFSSKVQTVLTISRSVSFLCFKQMFFHVLGFLRNDALNHKMAYDMTQNGIDMQHVGVKNYNISKLKSDLS